MSVPLTLVPTTAPGLARKLGSRAVREVAVEQAGTRQQRRQAREQLLEALGSSPVNVSGPVESSVLDFLF